MVGAEGLEAGYEVRLEVDASEEDGDGEEDERQDEGGSGENGGAVAEEIEDDERGDETQLLVPAPPEREPVVAGEEDGLVGGEFGWGQVLDFGGGEKGEE